MDYLPTATTLRKAGSFKKEFVPTATPTTLRRNGSFSDMLKMNKKPSPDKNKKTITMVDLQQIQDQMQNSGQCRPELTRSTSSSSVHSVHSSANLDDLAASLERQRVMRANSARNLAQAMSTALSDSTRNLAEAMSIAAASQRGTEPSGGLEGQSVDPTCAQSMHGRLESMETGSLSSSVSLRASRTTHRSKSDDGKGVPGARSVHNLYKAKSDRNLFSSSALSSRKKKKSDDTSAGSEKSSISKRRSRRSSMTGSTEEDSSVSGSTSVPGISGQRRASMSKMEPGTPNILKASLVRASFGLPAPVATTTTTTTTTQAEDVGIVASENGTSSTPCLATGDLSHLTGSTLADIRRSVLNRRASMSGSGGAEPNEISGPMIKKPINRRGSLSGMLLPPETQAPVVKKRRSRSRSASATRGRDDDKSVSSKSEKSTCSKSEKSTSSVPPETKPSEKKKKGRGRSKSVQRSSSSKSSDKSTTSSGISPDSKVSDRSGRSSKSSVKSTSGILPDSKASEKKGGGRSSKPSDKPTTSVPETKASEKGRGRSKRTPGEVTSNPDVFAQSNTTVRTEESKVKSKDVSIFGQVSDPGDFSASAAWDTSKDSFTAKGKTSGPADFPASASWDDDPWAEEVGLFNPKAPVVITKVEKIPPVATLGSASGHTRGSRGVQRTVSCDSFGGESLDFGPASGHSRESTGSGDASGHSRGSRGARRNVSCDSFGGESLDFGPASGHSRESTGSGAASSHSRTSRGVQRSMSSGESLDVASASAHSRGSARRTSLSMHVGSDTGSLSGHSRGPDAGSVSGRSRSSLPVQVTQRSHSIVRCALQVPVTKRRPSLAGALQRQPSVKAFGDFNTSDVKSVGFDGENKGRRKPACEDRSVTSVPPPSSAKLFAEKLEAAKKLDSARSVSQRLLRGDSDQDLLASARQRPNVPPPTNAALFAEKIEAAKRLDDARGASQKAR